MYSSNRLIVKLFFKTAQVDHWYFVSFSYLNKMLYSNISSIYQLITIIVKHWTQLLVWGGVGGVMKTAKLEFYLIFPFTSRKHRLVMIFHIRKSVIYIRDGYFIFPNRWRTWQNSKNVTNKKYFWELKPAPPEILLSILRDD